MQIAVRGKGNDVLRPSSARAPLALICCAFCSLAPAQSPGSAKSAHAPESVAHSKAVTDSHKTSVSSHQTSSHGTSKHSSTSKKHLKAQKGAWKHHGQQKIDDQRAREIQQALIREKYLAGEPSGVWDQQTKDAMSQYQDDHGWQTKTLPDSRALIELGLGPKHENLLNPESITPATPPMQNVPAGQPARAQMAAQDR